MGHTMNKTYYTKLDYSDLSLNALLEIAARENIPSNAQLDVSEGYDFTGYAITFEWANDE